MFLKRLCLLLLTSILFSTTSPAQPLSLQRCIEEAQQHSFILKADAAQAVVLQKEAQLAHSLQRPQLSGELATEQRFLRPYQYNQAWALVHADWSLGDYFLNSSRAVEKEALAAHLETEHQQLQISQKIAELYLHILLVEKHRTILLQREELLRSHYDLAVAQWQAGQRTQLDVLQTESNLSALKEEMARNDLVRDKLVQELRYSLGVPDDADIALAPLDSDNIMRQNPPQFESVNLNSAPALQVFDAHIAAQLIREQTVSAQQWPSLFAAGGVMADADPTGDGNYWQADIGLHLPLYRWGAVKVQKQQAKAALSALEWQKKQLEREMTISVKKSIAEMKNLQTVLASQQERQSINEQAVQFARMNYKAGLVTNLEYLTIQQELAESQINLQTTQLQYVLVLVEFYALTNQMDMIGAIQ